MGNDDSTENIASRDVEVSPKGITLRGAYEDMRPAIKRGVAIADSMLGILENVVGLPADFLNHHLGRFRNRYKEHLQEIPDEHREPPNFRTGCGVLKEVAFSIDEPNLQEMFAKLLATASDTRVQNDAHPGFANTINQLTNSDAEIINFIVSNELNTGTERITVPELTKAMARLEARDLRTSLDNLVRLGIIEWSMKGMSSFFVYDFDKCDINEHSHTILGLLDTAEEIRKLKKELKDTQQSLQWNQDAVITKEFVRTTEFGRQFIRACVSCSAE